MNEIQVVIVLLVNKLLENMVTLVFVTNLRIKIVVREIEEIYLDEKKSTENKVSNLTHILFFVGGNDTVRVVNVFP